MNPDMLVFRIVVERVSEHNLWYQNTSDHYKNFTISEKALFVFGKHKFRIIVLELHAAVGFSTDP